MEMKAIIKNPLGLHARASVKFVKTLANYPNVKLRVQCGTRVVNGDSLMSLMTLSAGLGSEITLSAEGEGADEACKALCELIYQGFGEI